MNGYYTSNNEYTARRERDIMSRVSARADRMADGLFAFLAWVLCALRDRTVRRVVRYALVGICFFCFIGLIGGIEQGLVSLGGGIVLGLFLVFVEILCLK